MPSLADLRQRITNGTLTGWSGGGGGSLISRGGRGGGGVISSAGDSLSPHKSALTHRNSSLLSSWDLDRAYDAAASGGSSGTGKDRASGASEAEVGGDPRDPLTDRLPRLISRPGSQQQRPSTEDLPRPGSLLVDYEAAKGSNGGRRRLPTRSVTVATGCKCGRRCGCKCECKCGCESF